MGILIDSRESCWTRTANYFLSIESESLCMCADVCETVCAVYSSSIFGIDSRGDICGASSLTVCEEGALTKDSSGQPLLMPIVPGSSSRLKSFFWNWKPFTQPFRPTTADSSGLWWYTYCYHLIVKLCDKVSMWKKHPYYAAKLQSYPYLDSKQSPICPKFILSGMLQGYLLTNMKYSVETLEKSKHYF